MRLKENEIRVYVWAGFAAGALICGILPLISYIIVFGFRLPNQI
ncbi:MAG: hypothetical protein AABY22_07290 [Nanoarchaeota archaeon]